ncbi:MAG TPA: DUF3482 domain-containing protein [Burkholderiales bacterium]|nr:DUF3482 domain-containing protein [Burkholderiales bacterium]
MSDAARIQLSLVSHTNVGKTTLARTLLGRTLGEIRDAPHVTAVSEAHTMIVTPEGDALTLWDTPGFGDSARLAKRLERSSSPIGWFLSEVWDRWRDRPLWSSQQAMRNVRDDADVVLYLVNAAENPGDAGYVAPEMQILDWIGKPAIVLLNQVGQPRRRADEAAEEARWRSHVGGRRIVHAVLTLDAFARCWVQEFTLLAAVSDALPAAKRPAFERLRAAWRARRMATFDAATAALAAQLARAGCDREPVADRGIGAALREVGVALGIGREGAPTARELAMQRLAERLDADVRSTTDRLIELHELEGRAAAEVLARLAEDFAVQTRASEGKAAILGGLVTGALTGLKADLATGGLTFGAGLLTGGVLGALGAAGIARGYNLVRGAKESAVRWSDEFLEGFFASALLRYLAVAHYGRGRGEWSQSEHPGFWKDAVAEIVIQRRDALQVIWAERGGECDPGRLGAALRGELTAAALDLLERLYPGDAARLR